MFMVYPVNMVEEDTASTPLKTRVAALLESLRPGIQLDGGDVELVDVSHDGDVTIRMLAACVECPSADLTLRQVIEQNLKTQIPEVRSVTAVK